MRNWKILILILCILSLLVLIKKFGQTKPYVYEFNVKDKINVYLNGKLVDIKSYDFHIECKLDNFGYTAVITPRKITIDPIKEGYMTNKNGTYFMYLEHNFENIPRNPCFSGFYDNKIDFIIERPIILELKAIREMIK